MKKNKIYKYIVIGVLIVSFFSLFLYKTPYVAAFNAKSLGHPSCNLPKGNLVVPIKLTYKDKAMLLNQLYTNALFTKAVREIEKENGRVDLLHPYIRAVDINGAKIEEVEYVCKSNLKNSFDFLAISRKVGYEFHVYKIHGKVADKNNFTMIVTNMENNSRVTQNFKNGKLYAIDGKPVDSINMSHGWACTWCIVCELGCDAGCDSSLTPLATGQCVVACAMACGYTPVCRECHGG